MVTDPIWGDLWTIYDLTPAVLALAHWGSATENGTTRVIMPGPSLGVGQRVMLRDGSRAVVISMTDPSPVDVSVRRDDRPYEGAFISMRDVMAVG
jgi:hypothetical protein